MNKKEGIFISSIPIRERKIPNYNSLKDSNLDHYFLSTKHLRHLIRTGVVNIFNSSRLKATLLILVNYRNRPIIK